MSTPSPGGTDGTQAVGRRLINSLEVERARYRSRLTVLIVAIVPVLAVHLGTYRDLSPGLQSSGAYLLLFSSILVTIVVMLELERTAEEAKVTRPGTVSRVTSRWVGVPLMVLLASQLLVAASATIVHFVAWSQGAGSDQLQSWLSWTWVHRAILVAVGTSVSAGVLTLIKLRGDQRKADRAAATQRSGGAADERETGTQEHVGDDRSHAVADADQPERGRPRAGRGRAPRTGPR